ncbi:NAD-dependent epimerase/dehydratase family protein [Inquilinus sp. CA228]|uniref:NAD-dependent epimerase/dehydratase family protein n=1 Tax=Inquilinus sp. CA228 TaxID=3455609 RepID=UPI003F8CFDAE
MASHSEAAGRVLVTGASGFTGHHVVGELLQAGYSVHGTGHQAPADDRVSVTAVDILDASALRDFVLQVRPRQVVHLAGISFVAHSNVDAIYRANIVGTRNLLTSLLDLEEKPESVILASSASVYGNTASAAPVPETVPLRPANDYGISKMAMEHVAAMFADRLPVTIVRPFNYTGVGQGESFLLPKIVSHFRKREPTIRLGNLDVSRDFSDVRQVAWAYRRLLASEVADGVFNICSGRAWSLAEILQMMAEIAGYEIAVEVDPALVRANELKWVCGDGQRLRATVGELPPLSLRQTLEWMYRAG